MMTWDALIRDVEMLAKVYNIGAQYRYPKKAIDDLMKRRSQDDHKILYELMAELGVVRIEEDDDYLLVYTGNLLELRTK